MQGTFFRGTTHTQDARFSDKEKKLLQTMNFDEILDKRVNLKKVDLDVLEPWVDQQVTKILGMDDEVIPAMIINELDTYKKDDKHPNGKLIQIKVTGFLERDAKKFMVELWKLLLEAQDSPHGIPTSLIESKKNELKSKEDEFKKNQDQLKKLEEAREKLVNDQNRLKELSKLFTDRSSSVERKPAQTKENDIKKPETGSRKEISERRHRESLKKFEEDEYLEKSDKNDDNKKKNRRSSSSSDSRHKKEQKKKDSHNEKDKKLRDDSSHRDRKNKDKYSSRDNKHKSSKSKRERSRS